jgi:hypothetical protein
VVDCLDSRWDQSQHYNKNFFNVLLRLLPLQVKVGQTGFLPSSNMKVKTVYFLSFKVVRF